MTEQKRLVIVEHRKTTSTDIKKPNLPIVLGRKPTEIPSEEADLFPVEGFAPRPPPLPLSVKIEPVRPFESEAFRSDLSEALQGPKSKPPQ